MLRIHEVKLNIEEALDILPERLIKKLGIKGLELEDYRIVKESIDARDKGEIRRVYSVDFLLKMKNKSTDDTEEYLLNACRKVKLERAPDMSYQYVEPGSEIMQGRPVIAGFGPCGMFAALILAEMGYRPVVLERGKMIADRVKDVEAFWNEGILNEESNVQFGEGGAGLFSDGKLTTQIKDRRIRKVLEEFVEAGAGPDLLYKQKPHIGTDLLRIIVFNIRKKIIAFGGDIFFESKLTGIDFQDKNGKLTGITVNQKDKIETENLVLAIGHSARDTFRFLKEQGVNMAQKPFSIGVRIEHPQSLINKAQYGKDWTEYKLGAADYKLSHRCGNGRGVYTFCMCPGGHVIAAASLKGGVVTNGMSYHNRDSENANSALLVDVRTEDFQNDDPLAGIEFQETYERLAFQAGGPNYHAPAQKLGDFMNHASQNTPEEIRSDHGESMTVIPSYQPGIVWTELSRCLPDFAVDAMKEAIPNLGRKLHGFDHKEAVMTGVETRSSSPIRILRGENYMSNREGLYPAGEGAGYAGGIMSAAVDGIRIAEEIAKKYQPAGKSSPGG